MILNLNMLNSKFFLDNIWKKSMIVFPVSRIVNAGRSRGQTHKITNTHIHFGVII